MLKRIERVRNERVLTRIVNIHTHNRMYIHLEIITPRLGVNTEVTPKHTSDLQYTTDNKRIILV